MPTAPSAPVLLLPRGSCRLQLWVHVVLPPPARTSLRARPRSACVPRGLAQGTWPQNAGRLVRGRAERPPHGAAMGSASPSGGGAFHLPSLGRPALAAPLPSRACWRCPISASGCWCWHSALPVRQPETGAERDTRGPCCPGAAVRHHEEGVCLSSRADGPGTQGHAQNQIWFQGMETA